MNKCDEILIHESKNIDINSLNFNEETKELIQVIGFNGYIKLCEHYGGTRIYIKKYISVIQNIRNKNIIKNFHNNMQITELVAKYRLTEASIRRIISKEEEK